MNLIYTASSYSSAAVNVSASLSIVPSEKALISITSFTGESGQHAADTNPLLEMVQRETASEGFSIKNNLAGTITITADDQEKRGILFKAKDKIVANSEKDVMFNIDAAKVAAPGTYNVNVTFDAVWQRGLKSVG